VKQDVEKMLGVNKDEAGYCKDASEADDME
jgi:hypothetical protein